MDAEVAKGHMGAKLAFTRLSFNYFITETVFRYIVDAVHLIADEGWKLLPLYRFDPDSGLWQHRGGARPTRRRACATSPPRSMARRRAWPRAPESVLAGQLEAAREIIDGQCGRGRRPGRCTTRSPSADFERVRWFPLPGEGLAQLLTSAA